MSEAAYKVNRWAGAAPTEQVLRQIYAREGLQPYAWSNGPHDVYGVHAHPYEKVLRVVRGSIRFDLAEHHTSVDLHPGDELVLPAGVAHSAVVGPEGVACLEAHRRSPWASRRRRAHGHRALDSGRDRQPPRTNGEDR